MRNSSYYLSATRSLDIAGEKYDGVNVIFLEEKLDTVDPSLYNLCFIPLSKNINTRDDDY